MVENTNEYGLVDFLVYNKYIKINLHVTETPVAKYAIVNSFTIFTNYIFIYLYNLQ